MRAFAAAALMMLLAGCTIPTDSGSSSSGTGPATVNGAVLTPTTYAVKLTQVPDMVDANATFTVRVEVQGSVVTTSPHIGAHIGPKQATPSTANYNIACIHTEGRLPDAYFVNCHAPAVAGTYHIVGHARGNSANGTQVDWWGEDHAIMVM